MVVVSRDKFHCSVTIGWFFNTEGCPNGALAKIRATTRVTDGGLKYRKVGGS